MKLYTDAEAFSLDGAVIAMGTFDGCHIGHRNVLLRAKAMAKRLGRPLLVYTYGNHPRAFFSPENAPGLLQTPAERAASIARLGADYLLMNRFDEKIAQTPADEFIWRLCKRFDMRGIVLGHSHSFGANREGNARMLKNVGKRTGFEVELVQTMRIGGISVHSERIREAVVAGDVRTASFMLGRSYAINGKVVEDYKTNRYARRAPARIIVPKGRLTPRLGVYAAYADLEGYSWPCVVHVVKRSGALLMEAHLIDFSGDVYAKRANIRFFAYLRPDEDSRSITAIQAEADETKARSLLL